MVTVTFKFVIIFLFVFGIFEVSCRQRDGWKNVRKLRRGDLDKMMADGDNSSLSSTTTTTTTTSTAAPTPAAPIQPNPVTIDPTNSFAPNYSDVLVLPIKYTKNWKKIKVSTIGFGLLTVSCFSLSAHFILLMLLLTNNMCVIKKKAPKLQSPAPISK
uniref:Uncharacterized protein n=1 Tax=Panagrolaimus sp. ES5 TaxID=591445 RepID=A0AC34GXS7_9BILA